SLFFRHLNGLRLKNFINASSISNKIQHLNLDDNSISSVHASSAPILRGLKELYINRNNLGDEEYVKLLTLTPNLKILNLNGNNVEKLDSYCFWNMPELNSLFLIDNPIITFNDRSFGGIEGFRSLHSTREYLCCIVPSTVIVCRPNPNQFSLSTCYDILSHDLLRIFIWVIGIISVVGNMISIRWHSQKKSSKILGIVEILLINLSAADFVMGVYLVIIASANVHYANRYYEILEEWLRSPPCLTASFCISLSSLMSTFVLFLITLDRYLHLVYPFQNYRLSSKTTILALVTFWITSITLSGLPIIYSIDQPSINRLYSSNSACLPGNFNNPYLLTWLLCYAGLTFVVWILIAIMYVAILSTLANSRKKAHRCLSKNDKIIRAKMIIIVATDLICWLPLYSVLIRGFGSGLDTHSLPFIAVLSLPLNSCINPILYTICTSTFINYINLAIGKLNCCSCLAFSRSIRESTQDIYTGSIHPSHVIALSSNPDLSKVYIKVKLPHNHKANKLGWLKFYSAKDSLPWEKEIVFYSHIKSEDCKLVNILSFWWHCDGSKCRVEIDGIKKLFPDEFMTCYTADANDIMLLSNFIRLQSNHLTSEQLLQILINIIQAIQSMHLNNIVHGSVNTDAVVLLIPPKEPITALLGKFSNTTIFKNDLHEICRDRYRQLLRVDISDIASLCNELSSYCQTQIDQINKSQLQPDKIMQAESWRSMNKKLRTVKDAINDQLQEDREPKQILADLWAIVSNN
ncbi:G-protein coupled receptor GRL101-like protein, partial [Trichoplax sp. H2]